jgi:GH25 family lysozyme M1 (1,4-beta-N-acetylmuramidase)
MIEIKRIKGIDVSYHQGNIDFKKVAKDGIQFVVLREGYRTTIDPKFI